MNSILIGAYERYAAEHGISAENLRDLIFSGEVFGDKDIEWIAAYSAGKEEKMLNYKSYNNMSLKDDSTRIEYVVAPTKEEADEWQRKLIESIRNFGKVTVSELYGLAGIKAVFVDFNYGWTDEKDIHYVRNRDGYWFNLPLPTKLSGVPTLEEQTKNTKVKIYLVVENSDYWPAPEVISAKTLEKDAKQEAYISAHRLFEHCFEEGHYPTIECIDGVYVVTDKEDDIRISFYVVEREVTV